MKSKVISIFLCLFFCMSQIGIFAETSDNVPNYGEDPNYMCIIIKAGDIKYDEQINVISFRNLEGNIKYSKPDTNLYIIDEKTTISYFDRDAFLDGSKPWITLYITMADYKAFSTGITVHVADASLNASALFTYRPTETEAIVRMTQFGIMTNGEDGCFRPDEYVTRAEMAKIIVSLRGVKQPDLKQSIFADVSVEHWGSPYIQLAADWGIINGAGNDLFLPDNPITFDEALKMLVTLLGYSSKTEEYGGYPKGFATIGQVLNLTLDIKKGYESGKSFVSRENMALMANAALDVPLMIKTEKDGVDIFEICDGKNLPLKTLYSEYFEKR